MTSFSIRLNPMQLSQLGAFLNIHGRIHNNQKDIYFLEWLGLPEPLNPLKKTLSTAVQHNLIVCLGTHMLPTPDKAVSYSAAAQALLEGSQQTRLLRLPHQLPSEQLCTALHHMIKRLPQSPPSSQQNNIAKLLCALDFVLPQIFSAQFPKCIWIGEPDTTAHLLLSILPYLGCDVAIVRPTGAQPMFPEAVTRQGMADSTVCAETFLRALQPTPPTAPISPVQNPAPSAVSSARPVLKLPQHPRRTVSSAPKPTPTITTKPPVSIQRPPAVPPAKCATTERVPLDYETLAGFSSSVVMIDVLDDDGEPQSSGSGVLIASGGIIITNFHVVGRGSRYAVHLENSDAVFETDQLLKYHQDFDLALLRLSGCHGQPIPLYQGSDLVRGQSVFAIGSPLGLFNSVSDGIISGFRQIEYQKMIQFTAPTSPGSSGGALLDRYGNLIGIVTAGFRDAQNINLAVSYEVIRPFARGFLSE